MKTGTLTVQQWHVMRALRKGWQSTTQLARTVHTTNAGIIRTGHSLRARGLVTTERRPHDGRTNVLGFRLTLDGTNLLQATEQAQ